MMLIYYARLPETRRITPEDHKVFRDMPWDPRELLELKRMTRDELMGLMCFCGIRAFDDTPIIACEDDELRKAYLGWRSRMAQTYRTNLAQRLTRLSRKLHKAHKGFTWWLEHFR